LFYLRTRGLSIKQAMEVLTYAFATDLVDCTPVSSTRDVISSLVESRLTKLIMDQAS